MRRSGLVGGSVSLGVCFKITKAHTRPRFSQSRARCSFSAMVLPCPLSDYSRKCVCIFLFVFPAVKTQLILSGDHKHHRGKIFLVESMSSQLKIPYSFKPLSREKYTLVLSENDTYHISSFKSLAITILTLLILTLDANSWLYPLHVY